MIDLNAAATYHGHVWTVVIKIPANRSGQFLKDITKLAEKHKSHKYSELSNILRIETHYWDMLINQMIDLDVKLTVKFGKDLIL